MGFRIIYSLKKFLFFPIAKYFAVFAYIRLHIWRPLIIVVTGSTGKTTLLHLLESQLRDRALYSHGANSAFGVPFFILGLRRKSYSYFEWIKFVVMAPLCLFLQIPREKIVIIEADCDRPFEGEFLSKLLSPDFVIWTGASLSHTVNFQYSKNEDIRSVQRRITQEFGQFVIQAKKRVFVNGDDENIKYFLKNNEIEAKIVSLKREDYFDRYLVNINRTTFGILGKEYNFKNMILPREADFSIAGCIHLVGCLGVAIRNFENFKIPPGRGSILAGIKETKLIDSSYNADPSSMHAILDSFSSLDSERKWLVLGDMVEQGENERRAHLELVDDIIKTQAQKIILVGPRLRKHTYPLLIKSDFISENNVNIETLDTPLQAYEYIKGEIIGEEVILFKGSRFLEGIVGKMLLNEEDSLKLCRRENVWVARRKRWGV